MLRKRFTTFILFAIISAVFLQGCTVGSGDTPADGSASIEEARKFYNEKQYSKSLEIYKQAINENPSLTAAYVEASEIFVLKKDYQSAIEILVNGEEFADEPDEIFYNEGGVYLAQESNEQALQAFQKAYELNPDNIANVLQLAKSYTENKQIAQAKTVLEDADINSSFERTQKYLYLALFSYDDYDEAMEYVEEGQKNAHADLKENLDNYEQALKDIRERNGDQVYSNTVIAYQFMANDFYKAAIPLLDQTVKLNDEHWAAFMYLGIAYMQTGQYKDAEDALRLAVSINPDNPDLHHLLAQAYTWQNNQEQAIESFEDALSVDQEEETILYDYARSLYKFGLYNKAEVEYKNLIALESSDYGQYHIELGYMYIDNQSKHDEAVKLMDTLINQWQGFDAADNQTKAKIYDIYGWALEETEQRDEGRKQLELAIELDPGLASTHYHLGTLLLRLDQFTDAKEELERAIDLDLEGNVTSRSKQELDKI